MTSPYIRFVACTLGVVAALAFAASTPAQTTTLADQPVFAGADVPGNLALALSVEYPTANSVANVGDYTDANGGDTKEYLGYFDPKKCYTYNYNGGTPASSYFQPYGAASGANLHQCSGQWSGNFLNWASMQTVDPFRWALSGGYRDIDQPGLTITEKAWASGQGGLQNFPWRGTDQPSNQLTGNKLSPAMVPKVTPFTAFTSFNSNIAGGGDSMVFAVYSSFPSSVVDLSDPSIVTPASVSKYSYAVHIRVKVCDPTVGVEANCVQYGNGYKPEGLLQQYSNKIRFAAFSYLNGDGANRQGGVLREPMGFIGPTFPQPYSATLLPNPTKAEWSSVDGTMSKNPDTTLSGVSNSGVMNYLNKFGTVSHTYMQDDNVSELYYAIIRYFEGLGNVPEWTNSASTTELEGFPAVTAWTGTGHDPILYSCQKNFILGIGDDHTHVDYNVGGATDTSGGRPKPSGVSSDSFNQATTWTKNLQSVEGITLSPWWNLGAGQATYYIAGLAYGAHVNDIRPDLAGVQTISTYWMDVAEYQRLENLNPYYLATKYGGFTVPSIYLTPPPPPATTPIYPMTTALTQGQWDTSGNIIDMNGNPQKQPDNYYVANKASLMVTGLKSAFASIANASTANTTSFSFSAANVSSAGTYSFGASYNASGWIGTVAASILKFDSSGNPLPTAAWSTDATFQSQLANSGWQTSRRIATWSRAGSKGVPFEATGSVTIDSAELSSLNLQSLSPSYSPTTTAAQYLSYLRGDQTNEVGATGTGSKSLRTRALLLGDIVDASLTPVTTPNQTFSETLNPGYATFISTQASRPTMVYAGANDGMLHAFVGSTGVEQFAYVPSATFQGPNGTPLIDGLAALGNPSFTHHNYVDATPIAFDVDFNHTYGNMTSTPAWRTVLIGGLGKGGKSFYAIDVTNPGAMTTESAVAGNVLWEVSNTDAAYATLGYSFGAPTVIKTAKYGWVAVLTSGYNNSDGFGYLYIVNPMTGALLEKIATPVASNGLTQASAYVKDYSDDTADSVYVGDLNGQLWRFDLTGSPSAYPAPTLLAKLTDASGNAQPITTAPLIEIYPTTRKRYVMVGTGQLLSVADVVSYKVQSFYAILDGTAANFSPVTTPYSRANSDFTQVTDVTTPPTIPPTSKGWFLDLGTDSTTGYGLRVVINPKAYNGTVSFATLLTSGDTCNPGGKGQVYVVNYASATSVLLNSNNTTVPPIAYQGFNSAVINLKYVGVNGGAELIAGLANGGIYKIPATLTGALATRILNWREVPTVE